MSDQPIKIEVELMRIGTVLEIQEGHLREHMKRSDANEKAVILLEKTLIGHMSKMNIVLGVLAAVGTAILAAVTKFLIT